MPDKALRDAAEALPAIADGRVLDRDKLVRWAVAAYLDSLLGELPEEAVEAGVQRAFNNHSREPSQLQRANVIGTFKAMVRSLRSSLGAGRA